VFRVTLAAFSFVCLFPAPALAHEYFLLPTKWKAAPGETWGVTGYVGTGFTGEPREYRKSRAVGLWVRDGSQGEKREARDLTLTAKDGDTTWISLPLVDAGGALVAYQSNYAFLKMEGAEFNQYLAEEGLDLIRQARATAIASDAPARERFRRVPKTWIAGPDAKKAKDRFTRPLGLPLEIVPEDMPGKSPKLRVRILWQGYVLPEALVRVWRQPPGAPQGAGRDSVGLLTQVRTDEKGRALVSVPGPGQYLVSCVHMVPAASKAEADWESTWASFTFSVE